MDIKYIAMLKWWLCSCLISISAVFVYQVGFFEILWEKDASYLSWVILALFVFFSFCCGKQIYRLCRKPPTNPSEYQQYLRYEEVGWFFSEVCLTIGMAGTIVGFVFMLSGFEGVDMNKPHTVQYLLSDLGKSMATALYTTLIGLVCGVVLKVQYFIMSLELKRLEVEQPSLSNNTNEK